VGGNGALRNLSGNNTNTGTIVLASASRLQTESGTTLTQSGTVNNGGFALTVNSVGTTVISGAITNTGGLIKDGAGLQALTGANTFTGAISVQAGTLELAGVGGNKAGGSASTISVATGATLLLSQGSQFNNAPAVTLSGGTIGRGAGVSEVFGSLNVTSASFLDFGTGDAGNITAGNYTKSAILTLNNFFPGNTFTFTSGTFSSGSVGDYFAFTGSFENYSLSNTGSTFTITAIPEPSAFVAAAGLLALMLWPARRRLRDLTSGLLPSRHYRREW